MSLLELKDLQYSYKGTLALKGLSLKLEKGKIVGLLGPNGSGKTTLIKVVCGLLKSYKGEVLIEGTSPGKHTKSLISYLPDTTYLADWMTPLDAIAVFADFYSDFDKEKCESMISLLQLPMKKSMKSMSKGMKEKLQLSLVMSRRARIYLLDEPIGGVDPAARDVILDTILSNYNPESTIIISTHLITDVERIFNDIIFLKEGNIVCAGNADEIREKEQKSIDELFREVFKC